MTRGGKRLSGTKAIWRSHRQIACTRVYEPRSAAAIMDLGAFQIREVSAAYIFCAPNLPPSFRPSSTAHFAYLRSRMIQSMVSSRCYSIHKLYQSLIDTTLPTSVQARGH